MGYKAVIRESSPHKLVSLRYVRYWLKRAWIAFRGQTAPYEGVFQALLNDDVVLYYAFYTFCALNGVLLDNLWVAILLYDIVWRNPILKFIIRSAWRPRKTMAMTFILFIIVQFFLVMLAYTLLYEDLFGHCDRFWTCFLRLMDQSFKQNAGIGSYIDSLQEKFGPQDLYVNEDNDAIADPSIRWGRLLYDYLGFFLPVVILILMITGMIADTFKVLRKEEEERNDDMRNLCFICGIPKVAFEEQSRSKIGFENHIKNEHHMWNYVYYIAYNRSKRRTDYSGQESYVHNCLTIKDLSWFPISKSLSLGNYEVGDSANTPLKMVKLLDATLDGLDNKLNHITKLLDAMEEN
eukprot:TRINITY_DN13115_c0_g1_i1.p1 TRINITY_DN13115_c0_g1~~TRINITY_DN13115_c0_g1_i1.p1  ORF type:complete len:350 (+),score=34.57 TRINITY_DN13115_c0_g1_i1:3-1052(+)